MADTSKMFAGTSRYSNDFQSVIERSVKIASLPMTLMRNQVNRLQDDSSALSSIDAKMVAFQSAIAGLDTALGTASYSANSSNADILTVSVTDGVREGVYHVTVSDAGAYPLAVSKDAGGSVTRVYDPTKDNVSAATEYSLTIGTGAAISLTASNLQALADQINSKAGERVSATVVNIGSADGRANYKLSLQGRSFEAQTFMLTGTPSGGGSISVLQDVQQQAGRNISYSVNGSAPASATSRNVSLAPGVTLTLKKADDDTDVEINVTRGTSSVQAALGSFVQAYNGVIDELNQHVGQSGGALTGDSTLRSLSSMLSGLGTWDEGSGTLASLASLGLLVDRRGKLSLDSAVFAKATANGMADVSTFFGGATSGGFLKTATDSMDAVLQKDTGLLRIAESITTASISNYNKRIADEQTRIDALQQSLAERMAAADALIASMEQQASYITNMFQAMLDASKTYQ